MYLPHWPLARRLRRTPPRWRESLAVARVVRGRAEVVDATPSAARAGVRVGLTVAEGRALCPGLITLDHDPAADQQALEALGRWMTRYTPSVATAWEGDPPAPPVLFLDVTGCERLFGSVRAIVVDVRRAMCRFGLPARVAAAPTVGAAWALARCQPLSRRACLPLSRSERRASSPAQQGDWRERLASLPVRALRLDTTTTRTLRALSLLTVGHVLALPRDTLPARFGPAMLTRIDQLLGTRREPLVPLAYDVPVEARIAFDGPVDSLDTLTLVLQELVRRVVADLSRRGRGARLLELRCDPERHTGQPPIVRRVRLGRPVRDPKRLLRLLAAASEKLDCGNGFVAVGLKVPTHEPVAVTQRRLLANPAPPPESTNVAAGVLARIGPPTLPPPAAGLPREDDDGPELSDLIDHLRARFGDAVGVRPRLIESHVPERAWQAENEDGEAASEPTPAGDDARLEISPRPLCLLTTPAEIAVVAEPDDGVQGRPAQFTYRGRVHRIVHALGPERVCGEWWRGHHKVRDYYDALDATGRRFWVFRVVAWLIEDWPSKRWFLQGHFK